MLDFVDVELVGSGLANIDCKYWLLLLTCLPHVPECRVHLHGTSQNKKSVTVRNDLEASVPHERRNILLVKRSISFLK